MSLSALFFFFFFVNALCIPTTSRVKGITSQAPPLSRGDSRKPLGSITKAFFFFFLLRRPIGKPCKSNQSPAGRRHRVAPRPRRSAIVFAAVDVHEYRRRCVENPCMKTFMKFYRIFFEFLVSRRIFRINVLLFIYLFL